MGETSQGLQAFKIILSWPFILKISTLFCYNIQSQYIKFFEIVFVWFLSSVFLSFKDEEGVLLSGIKYL